MLYSVLQYRIEIMYIKNQYDTINLKKEPIALQNNETIVENINRLIAHIQHHKIVATKANRHFGMKHIISFNELLTNPIEILSLRPSQKTYPNVNGLYLLLRSMGFLRFKFSKKETEIEIEEETLSRWQQLNKTEQYFMLLEFWLIHANPEEIIDGFHRSAMVALLDFFLHNGFARTKVLSELSYNPEYTNIALSEMFGFVELETSSPKEKNRWNITNIHLNPLVKKILSLINIQRKDDLSLLLHPPKIGFFQTIFQPHFREFNQTLVLPSSSGIEKGVYRLKLSLGRIYRTIEIDANSTFEFLANSIVEQFDFDSDHLYEFSFVDNFGKKRSIKHSYMSEELEGDFWADEYCLKNLPLKALEHFEFIFDFSDWWEFDILIENIDESREIDKIVLIKSHGEAPKQYDFEEF